MLSGLFLLKKDLKTGILEEYLHYALISCDLLDTHTNKHTHKQTHTHTHTHTIPATTVLEGSSSLAMQLKPAEEKMSGSKTQRKFVMLCFMISVEGC
jgi:hypothetical protein